MRGPQGRVTARSRVPPIGRRIEVPLVANFDFDGDLLIGEKVNFDLAALIRQLEA